jgi:hypothetical protein
VGPRWGVPPQPLSSRNGGPGRHALVGVQGAKPLGLADVKVKGARHVIQTGMNADLRQPI